MGIQTRSAHIGELLSEVSIQVIGKGGVPGTGFVGPGSVIPNITFCCFPKITKEHTVLFSISTLNDGDAHLNACCCFSTPIYATSQLDEGILCIFSAGKAWLW
jgi:hypothetical protein